MKVRQTSVLAKLVLTTLTAVSFATSASSQVPSLISYQGRLVTAAGTAVSDGTHEVLFSIHDATVDGNLIWAGLYDVTVLDGRFSIFLGAAGKPLPAGLSPKVNDLGFAFTGGDGNRFLEIKVGNFPPLLPRQLMGSVPYAVTSANGSPPGTVVAFFGPEAPVGWVFCDGASYPETGNYARLFSVIGRSCGGSESENTFRVPDLRGRFLRGTNSMGSGQEAADLDKGPRTAMASGGAQSGLGSIQNGSTALPHNPFVTSKNGLHSHGLDTQRTEKDTHFNGGSIIDVFHAQHRYQHHQANIQQDGEHVHTIESGGDLETRPVNAACHYIIKL